MDRGTYIRVQYDFTPLVRNWLLCCVQEYDTQDNPNLVMPPKPTDALTGSGAEFYNIDFDPEKLKAGAVVSQSKPAARSFTSRMVRDMNRCV